MFSSNLILLLTFIAPRYIFSLALYFSEMYIFESWSLEYNDALEHD